MYPRGKCNGDSLAIRDDDMGLHQSRYAFRKGGLAKTQRGVRPDSLSALQKRCHPGGPGSRRSKSAADQDAESRWICATRVEAWDAAAISEQALASIADWSARLCLTNGERNTRGTKG